MKYLIIIAALFTASCGNPINHKVEDVKGEITVKHTFEVAELRKYFLAKCEAENPTYTNEELQDCADAAIGNFLSFLGGS